jgi:hypothetical protein
VLRWSLRIIGRPVGVRAIAAAVRELRERRRERVHR